MGKQKELRELAQMMFGDDPKWAREADRIEGLVAAGEIEDAGIALSSLAFERLAGRRNGIDVAIVRANAALMAAAAARGDDEAVERGFALLENTPDLDKRAAALARARLDVLGLKRR